MGFANSAESIGGFEEGFGGHAATEDAESAEFAGPFDHCHC